MDAKLLRSFIILSQCSSYREASDRLFITQPTLTKQINVLEKELGVALFIRDNQGARLSEEGRMIYEHALVLEQQINHFRCIARKISTGKTGHLTLAYTSSFLDVISHAVGHFKQQYPDVSVNLIEMPSHIQEVELLKKTVDVGFKSYSDNRMLSFIPMGSDRLCLVTNRDLHLQENDINSMIHHHNLLVLDEKSNPDLCRAVSGYMENNEVQNRATQYLNNIYNMLTLVKSGLGFALLTQSIFSFLNVDLRCYPLTGVGSEWQIGIAWNPNYESALRKDFIDSVSSPQRSASFRQQGKMA